MVLGILGATSNSLLGLAGQAGLSYIGNLIETQIFGKFRTINHHGARLKNHHIQTNSYGGMIPLVYGTMRLAGNIIWTERNFRENSQITSIKTKSNGRKITENFTNYSYVANFAIGICEGELEDVVRIWANDELLNLSKYKIRVYAGTQSQAPDSSIEKIVGYGKTSAYRGLAYVVFEDFPISEYGNAIPNFTFEVRKKSKMNSQEAAEYLISSIVMIPGGGEFVYDTILQYKIEGDLVDDDFYQRGKSTVMNMHTEHEIANSIISLNQLQQTLPNVEWVSVVVNWFATSLDIKEAEILPGVEFSGGSITYPDKWIVENWTRETAHKISQENSKPIFGGTINDASIVRYLEEIKSRNMNVMFYPMLFVDHPNKPWRGMITGDASDVDDFFARYDRFILHYANLVKGKVDGFIIGSELKELTSIKDENHNYPSVVHLVNLASKVREVLGSDVVITYAADWSEYHHDSEGYYHLDQLWASDDIDVIGIDAYFPLTNSQKSIYDIEELKHGFESGEGYEFIYLNSAKTESIPTEDRYAWKNIRWWWENDHIQPNGKKTEWVARSKKIWFTEYGFPSIDAASNEPNLFWDPSLEGSRFPKYSKGNVDFLAQRAGIEATELYWQNSEFVERKFLWTWDARPYPYWPDFQSVWSDGKAYMHGHWVQGKLGNQALHNVIEELCGSVLEDVVFNYQNLSSTFYGMVIEIQSSVKSNIELLQDAYFFDVIANDKAFKFSLQSKSEIHEVDIKDLIINDRGVMNVNIQNNKELPSMLDVNFINRALGYKVGNQHRSIANNSCNKISQDLPISLTDSEAANIAEINLSKILLERQRFNFSLPSKYMHLTPGDILQIANDFFKIEKAYFGNNFALEIDAVLANPAIYKNCDREAYAYGNPITYSTKTNFEILDIPDFKNSLSLNAAHLLIACYSIDANWVGGVINIELANQDSIEIAKATKEATVGSVLSNINQSDGAIVNLISGDLNLEENQLQTLALIRNEIIEIDTISLVVQNQYKISFKERGLFNTENEMQNHSAGDRFLLLNNALVKAALPETFTAQDTLLTFSKT